MKIKGLIDYDRIIALMLGSCAQEFFQKCKNEKQCRFTFLCFRYQISTIHFQLTVLASIRGLVAKAMQDGKEGKPEMTEEMARTIIMKFVS